MQLFGMAPGIAALLAGALARDAEAWGALVDGHGPVVWGTLRKFTGLSEQERRDLFQDVFVVLLERGLKAFRGTGEHEFRSYLKTITENEAKSLLRRHGRRVETLDPLLADRGWDEGAEPGSRLSIDPSPGPEQLAVGQEAFEKFRLCFQYLASTDQQLFWMRIRGWSYEDIAGALAVPMGTVASKYHRAKARIEECLKNAGIL